MPYINKTERAELDELIDALSTRIKSLPGKASDPAERNSDDALLDYAGRLNYVTTRLCLNLMGSTSYWKIATICGVLSNVAAEFYRKLAIPYEDKKIAENGDVYPSA